MSPMARQRASMVLAPEVGLELGEGHFAWVQVRAVWRQEEEPGAALPEDGLGLFAFMRREVVEDDDVAGLQCRGKLRGDVEVEHLAVHRTIDDPGGGQAIAPQCGDERLRFPVTARRPRLEPLVAPGPAAQAYQFGRRGRFIDEDEAVRLAAHARLAAAAPHPAVLADVIAPALRGHQCFFLKEKPAFDSSRDSDAGWARTPTASSLAASSGIVMSGSASTQAMILSIRACSLPSPGGRPCRAGAVEPDTATRRASFTAKLALTPK